MVNLQILHTVTAVKDPFADIADTCRKTDMSKILTFEKGTFLQYFQRLRKLQMIDCTEVKSFFADLLQSLREIYRGEIFAFVKSASLYFCKRGRKIL